MKNEIEIENETETAFQRSTRIGNERIASIPFNRQLTLSEDDLHCQCYDYYVMQYDNDKYDAFFHHSPNELAKGASFGYVKKMIRLGMLVGFPDVIIGYKGKFLFIELKSKMGGVSAHQKKFGEKLKRNGFEYHLIRSFETFQSVVDNFFTTDNNI
jgi:hypothetical protein